MTTIKPMNQQVITGHLPRSLTDWVDENTLVRLVLAATTEGEDHACPDALPVQEPGCRPPVLLAILTCAYATGLLSSEEIAGRITSDAALNYLAANRQPSAFHLRQFRRRWRPLIEQSLVKLFQMAWEIHQRADHREATGLFARCLSLDAEADSVIDPFALEAEERISRAVQLDSMDLDI